MTFIFLKYKLKCKQIVCKILCKLRKADAKTSKRPSQMKILFFACLTSSSYIFSDDGGHHKENCISEEFFI